MVLQAKKVSKNVWWVGALDWDLRLFHGYATSRGSTYNAFLIVGEKNILVDTVKRSFYNELKDRVISVLGDMTKIDYFISLHSELDHAGCIPLLLRDAKPEKFFCSKNGLSALKHHHHDDLVIEPEAINPKEPLVLGEHTFQFIITAMLHWPDSMMSYYENDGLLFSQDGFGMHLCTTQRFDYELPKWLLEHESRKYYANILLPFSKIVTRLSKELLKLNLPLKMICPDHGPIWRDYIPFILEKYVQWSSQDYSDKVVIVYDTMWESTRLMATYICDALVQTGCRVKCVDATRTHRSDIATTVASSGAVIFGSPTLNNGIFPSIAENLSYIEGLKPLNKIGAVFGSYGWSGESTKILTDAYCKMGIEIVADPVKVKYVPTQTDLDACYEMGTKVGEELMKRFNDLPKAIPRLVTLDDVAIDQTPLFLLSYGLYMISSRTEAGDKLNGQISTDAFQVTDTPGQVVVCINKSELTHQYIMESGVCTVSVLAESMPQKTIGLFGFKSGRDVDKFAKVGYELTKRSGCPYLTDHNIAFVDLIVMDRHSVGTHTLFVCKVIECEILMKGEDRPMTYKYYQETMRGRSPPNAPTFHMSDKMREEAIEKLKKSLN